MKTLVALDRRDILRMIASAGLVPLFGCAGASRTGDPTSADAGQNGECSKIPEETGGPYPGDGSNGPNILSQTGIVRSDIRSSIGSLSGTAEGIPLTIRLTVVAANANCEPLAGYAVYAWQCDRDGDYSMYTNTSQNYLRGVQETDENGVVTFTSIFPACYPGRMPHVHFEIYPSLASAAAASGSVATSQLAFPNEVSNDVYATSAYAESVRPFSQISFATDMVFQDGVETQLATVTGNVNEGYVATLSVGINM